MFTGENFESAVIAQSSENTTNQVQVLKQTNKDISLKNTKEYQIIQITNELIGLLNNLFIKATANIFSSSDKYAKEVFSKFADNYIDIESNIKISENKNYIYVDFTKNSNNVTFFFEVKTEIDFVLFMLPTMWLTSEELANYTALLTSLKDA